jgi:hypothetical protein
MGRSKEHARKAVLRNDADSLPVCDGPIAAYLRLPPNYATALHIRSILRITALNAQRPKTEKIGSGLKLSAALLAE